MLDKPLTGVFGKLPLHGDFVYRNLPADFMNGWDEWVQRFIAGSQEQLGEGWLDVYLTSPIWRFVFSEGVLDENAWLGIIMPSVDKVGRYFPISVITQVPPSANLLEFMLLQKEWYENVEEFLFQALDGELDVDELMDAIDETPLNYNMLYNRVEHISNQSSAVINLELEEQSPALVFPHLLDSFLLASLSSYSAWTTVGSERVEPCISITQSLPKIGGIAAMLDGQWSQWNWQQPYSLNAFEQ
ncbi:type VI secretion system-associated protein TagF [Aliikangiella sp. IMCC44359]|uniref:type VI secretion system-associated protein TagF n=1 Tax=Aliikangiella sp. IMCC44359 TaxID=3459125 RepID=UPI00403A919B